ncbi:MAG: hypothetical protein AB1546_00680, partial [bacterium]
CDTETLCTGSNEMSGSTLVGFLKFQATTITGTTVDVTSGATNIDFDAPTFKVVFNGSLDSTITPTGFSLDIENQSTGISITITNSNYTDYGTLTYTTTTETDDTLSFTLKSNATLKADSLQTLKPSTTYAISNVTIPTNLEDTNGNPVYTSGITTTGTFTTGAGAAFEKFQATNMSGTDVDVTSGATNVAYDGTTFKAVFSASLDSTITPTGFAFTIENLNTGVSIVIDDSNSSDYGTLSYSTTTSADDTIEFALKSNTELESASLNHLQPGTPYEITDITIPTNIEDTYGNSVDTSGVPASGTFTTGSL